MSRPALGWYLRRLRRMSPAEVTWRSVDYGRRAAWLRRQVRRGEQPDPRARPTRKFEVTLPPSARAAMSAEDVAALVRYADELLAGRDEILGVLRTDLQKPDWFLDPVSGQRSDPAQYAFRVPYRDETAVGNVKQVWELSRLHHLTAVAAAWYVTEDQRYADYVDQQVRSWIRLNPFLSGIHWTSGIELGIRLISLVWIRRLLDGWSGVRDLFDDNDRMLRQLRWHQEYLHALRSRGSSGNNHLVAEAAGRLVAAHAFPWYDESERWQRSARRDLEAALVANTFGSGLNRELASEYHGFVAELAIVAACEADAAGDPLAESSWALIGRMLDAAAAVVDETGMPPAQGDGDGGRVLVVDAPPTQHGSWARLLGLGTAVVGGAPWWPAGEPSVLAALLPAIALPRRAAHPDRRPDHFPDAGLTVLRGKHAGREIWCRADSGPHGFLAIAGHAHADALSVEVRYGGVNVLADPGTYCYHGEPEWRNYFRSTRAHNTVEIDGEDQSVSGGPFLWSVHAVSETDAVATAAAGDAGVQHWMGSHHGYERLDSPVTHQRRATLDPAAGVLTIVDRLVTTGRHRASWTWQFGPDVDVELDGSCARLSFSADGRRVRATMTLPSCVSWSAHRGESFPPAGWHSPSFGVRRAATALVGQGRLERTAEVVTVLRFEAAEEAGS